MSSECAHLAGPLPAAPVGGRERLALGALLLLVALPRLAFSLRTEEGVLAAPIVDDGYYNLTVARNLALGRGLTFDGTSTTTGFHPLVVALAAPVFWLTGGGTTAPLRILLLCYTLLGLWLAWLLYGLVRGLAGPLPALTALLLYATGSATGILINTLNGCDTVFGGVLLLVLVRYYLQHFRQDYSPPLKNYVVLGALAGALGWARLDLGFFAAALGLDLLRRRTPLRALLVWGGAGLAVLSPWLLFNVVRTGSLLPDNGRAVTLISRATASVEVRWGEAGLLPVLCGGAAVDLDGVAPYPGDQPPPAFYRTMLWHAFLSLVRETPATGILDRWGGVMLRGLEGLGLRPWSRALRLLGWPLVLAVLAAAGLLFQLARQRRALREPDVAPVLFLLPGAAALFLAYPLVVLGQWFYGRYFFPLVLTGLLLTPLLLRLLPLRPAALVVLFLGAFALDTLPGVLEPRPRSFYRQARRIATLLPRRAVVAATQAGHFGFFCPQRVINLDGKVSRAAYRALQKRRVLAYARRQGVQYVTDVPVLVDLLIRARSRPEEAARLVQIDPPPGRRANDLGWVTYALR